MVLPAGQGQVPHPSIAPECFTINQLWNDRCTCEKCWMQVSPVPASDEVCLLAKLRSAGCKCLRSASDEVSPHVFSMCPQL
ncbi:hypothetical protein TNCV_1236201 [Trichonephila clavipes]|nr:hypothetical protein TNCV_1236201 [Trichonephila clavipes]